MKPGYKVHRFLWTCLACVAVCTPHHLPLAVQTTAPPKTGGVPAEPGSVSAAYQNSITASVAISAETKGQHDPTLLTPQETGPILWDSLHLDSRQSLDMKQDPEPPLSDPQRSEEQKGSSGAADTSLKRADTLNDPAMGHMSTVNPVVSSSSPQRLLHHLTPSITASSPFSTTALSSPEQSGAPPDSLLLATPKPNETKPSTADTAKLKPRGQKRRGNCDIQYCRCKSEQLECTTRKKNPPLDYIPTIQDEVKKIKISKAHLPNLTRVMLTNMSRLNITSLRLLSSNIHRLENNTFADFHRLKEFDLSGNHIPAKYLVAGLNSMGSSRLEKLYLEKMGLSSLPDNLFNIFTNQSLRIVSLKGNKLRTFDSSVFKPFWRVVTADFSQNNLIRVNMSRKVNIAKLILSNNYFGEFPDFCLRRSSDTVSSAFYGLTTLKIDKNPYRRVPPDRLRGHCFPHLLSLDISSASYVHTLEDNFIADLPRLSELQLRHMEIQLYKRFAFNSSSLQRLNVYDSSGIKSRERNYYELFRNCPNLKKLSIIQTALQFKEDQVWHLLVPLTSLTHLTLNNIRRGFLPADLLWRLPNLTVLNLISNSLSSEMLGRALQNVTSVRSLNVRSNDITVVDEHTLPWPFRSHLRYLDLVHNPFSCTCQLRWFQRWLDEVTTNGSVKIHRYQSKYSMICDTPPKRKGLPLAQFHLSDEECKENMLGIILGITCLCLLGIIIAFSLAAYRYRLYLRSYLYRLRRRREHGKGGRPPHIDFDIYIACSPRDTDWVCSTLLPFLEGERGLSVFLRHRNAQPGTFEADNIIEFIEKSARILLLISDVYVNEAWCQYEFQHIIYAAIDQQKDVIVVLKDVNTGTLTKDMIRMLTRGTYLHWQSSEQAQRLFHEGLVVALRTADDGIYSTLC